MLDNETVNQDLSTKEKIIEEALKLFSTKGYVGTSMDDLGLNVGIKKASIYSHYKSKDEIYLEVVKRTMELNLQFFREAAAEYDPENCRKFFENYFTKYAERCYSPVQECNIKMLKRCALYPPPTLKEKIASLFELYYYEIESLLAPILIDAMNRGKIRKISLSYILDIFSFILDGIFTEAHFTNKWKYFTRTEQAINVFLNYVEE
ncbi:MAG: TetR/AcrR family transcriptional regulator [Dehalobacterium sp.]